MLLFLSAKFHIDEDTALNRWWAWKFWLYAQAAPRVLLALSGVSEEDEDEQEPQGEGLSSDDLVDMGLIGDGR